MKNFSDSSPRILLPTLIAVGGSLIAAPASAMGLSEIKVHSTLGQPLRASIAYALGPNEAINSSCVTVQSGLSSSGLPAVNRASIVVIDGIIAIRGHAAVREPMMAININIRCPYSARLNREYTLFIDPAETMPLPVAVTATAPVNRIVVSRPVGNPATTITRRRPVNRDPIDVARYRVQPGDTLSVIAQRIENRPLGLWPTSNAIFEANPGAFIDSNPNRLRAGSWLNLSNIYLPEPQPVTEVAAAIPEPEIPTAYAPPDFQPLREPEAIVIPDTVLEGPIVPVATVRPTATIRPAAAPEQSPTNWLIWLVSGGIAIIAGLLFFGRFRDRFSSTPIGAVAAIPRHQPRNDVQPSEVIGDVALDDDAPTAENLILDVDLQIGVGLQDSGSANVIHDFGFAETTSLDFSLPEETLEEIPSGTLSSETDIIPPLNLDEESILLSEELPEEDDDYDMSVMIDATKMPRPEDVTERDLEAVQVEVDDGTLISSDYTISQEVNYEIIEQDYEDEMTATQALNKEIAKAASELADRMDEDNDTTDLPLASVTELDITAQLPEQDDEAIGDLDDTGINPAINVAADS